MSLVVVIWSMNAGICLALAGVHLLVWVKSREAWANLFFSVYAVSAAVTAMLELSLMHSPTPEAGVHIFRWRYLSVGFATVALAWFVRLFLQQGSLRLVWLFCAWRALVQILDPLFEYGLNFSEITGLRQIPLLNDVVVRLVGVPSPWLYFSNGSTLLLLVFVLDATIAAWRRGDRRRAKIVGGTVSAAAILGISHSLLWTYGKLLLPYSLSLEMLVIVVAVAHELSVDLSQARQVSRDLERSQKRVNMAAWAGKLGLWEWDVVRNEFWVNQVAYDRSGIDVHEHFDFDRFLRSVHPDDREATRQKIQRILEDATEMRIEYRAVNPKGETRWMEVLGRVERDANGKAVLLRGVSLDVTLERERMQLKDDLAHVNRVMQMSELSTSLAHEINQPLAAILNTASAARILVSRLGEGNERFTEALGDIVADARRAGNIVRNLRELVRKKEARLQPLDMNLVIAQATELFRQTFISRHVSLRLDLQPNLAKINGNSISLQQVMVNLISNALDVMEPSPVRNLRIRSSMVSPGLVTVSVADSGPGIDPANRDSLFKPFFSTKQSGLGMGLRICRSIIEEEHGGNLWFENNPAPETGATFSFSVPILRGASG